MTAVLSVALAVAVVAVALLLARQRSLRRELEAARRAASTAVAKAEEAERVHRERQAASTQELATAAARVVEAEAAMSREGAAAEARQAELEASSRRRIQDLERDLHQSQVEVRRTAATAATHAADAEAAQGRVVELEAAAEAGRAERAAAAARVAALEADLAAARSAAPRTTPPRATPAPPTPALATPAPAPGPEQGDAGWSLLAARVERQWADLVNAGPDERGVVDGPRSEQLVQAAQRELERLREEVGVETAMAVTEPVEAGHALTTLLVVGEAAALLASRSERVSVELGGRAVVTGEDWAGDEEARRRLDRLVAAASAAGWPAVVEPDDRGVRVVLG